MEENQSYRKDFSTIAGKHQFEALKGEINLTILEKHEFQHLNEIIIQIQLVLLFNQDSNTATELINFLTHCCSKTKILTATLIEQTLPVVTKNYDVEYRDLASILVLGHSQTVLILTVATKSTFLKSRAPQKQIMLETDLEAVNQVSSSERNELEYQRNAENNIRSFALSDYQTSYQRQKNLSCLRTKALHD